MMVQGGWVVTVMTSSNNMNLFFAGNPAEFSVFWKACKVSGVVYTFMWGFLSLCVCELGSFKPNTCV